MGVYGWVFWRGRGRRGGRGSDCFVNASFGTILRYFSIRQVQ